MYMCEPLGIEEPAECHKASLSAFQAHVPLPCNPTLAAAEGESAPLDNSEVLRQLLETFWRHTTGGESQAGRSMLLPECSLT